MSGSTELSKVTVSVVKKYAPRVVGKSLSKFIPFIGAAISFVSRCVRNSTLVGPPLMYSIEGLTRKQPIPSVVLAQPKECLTDFALQLCSFEWFPVIAAD